MLFLRPLLRLLCRARSCLEVWSAAAWQGWRIEFSETFLQGLDSTSREHLLSGKAWSTSDGKGKPEEPAAPAPAASQPAQPATPPGAKKNMLHDFNLVPCCMIIFRGRGG